MENLTPIEAAKLLGISIDKLAILERQGIIHSPYTSSEISQIKSRRGLTLSDEASIINGEIQRETVSSISLFQKILRAVGGIFAGYLVLVGVLSILFIKNPTQTSDFFGYYYRFNVKEEGNVLAAATGPADISYKTSIAADVLKPAAATSLVLVKAVDGPKYVQIATNPILAGTIPITTIPSLPETGVPGLIGPTGEAGPQGPRGVIGPTGGSKGDKGDTGLTGATGGRGDKGDTGNTVLTPASFSGSMLYYDGSNWKETKQSIDGGLSYTNGKLLLGTGTNIDPDNKSMFQINLPSDNSETGIYVKGSDYLIQADTYSGSATMLGLKYLGNRKWDINLNDTQLEFYSYGSSTSVVLLDPTGLTINGDEFISGKVGIGTTNPTSLLHLNKTADDFTPALYIYSTNADSEITLDGGASPGGGTAAVNLTSGTQTWQMSINGIDVSNNWNVQDTTAGTVPLTVEKGTGNVGIGTITPAANLDIVNPLIPESRFAFTILGSDTEDTDTELYIQNRDGIAGIHIQPYGVGVGYDNFWIGSDGDNTLRFRDDTAGIIPLTIQGVTGNVGIGTTTPAYALDVKTVGTGIIARFNNDNNTGCTLATNGTLSCTSDRSLKKNIGDIGYGLSDVIKLNPVAFNWNSDSGNAEKSLGFIAQDMQGVIPNLVTTDQNGLLTLNTIGMIPVLTKSIQELSTYIGPVVSGNLSGLVLGIKREDPRDSTTVIESKIASSTKFLTDFISARVTAIRGYFDEIFAKKVHTEQICLKKSDGGEVCIDGNQLEKLLPAPSPSPSSTPVADTTPSPTPSTTESPSPSESPSITP